MDNLIAPRTMEGVQQIQTDAKNLVNQYTSNVQSRRSELGGHVEFIDDLIRETMYEETKLYHEFEVTNIQELQKKITAILGSDGSGQWLQLAINEIIDELKDELVKVPIIHTQTVLKRLNEALHEMQFQNIINDATNDVVSSFINEVDLWLLDSGSDKKLSQDIRLKKSSKSSDASKGIKALLRFDQKKRQWYTVDNKSLITEDKRILMNYLNRENSDYKYNLDKSDKEENFQEILIPFILKNKSLQSHTEFYNKLQEFLLRGISDYKVYRNVASVRGFLGELFFNTAMYAIHPTADSSNIITSVGGTLNSLSQQINVDTMIGSAGFQVKQYKKLTRKNTFDYSVTNQAAYFIDQRTALSGNVRDVLIALFGSYAFNQPFQDDDRIKEYEAKNNPVSVYEDTVYNRFKPLIESTANIFKYYADNIIYLSRTVGDEINKKMYLNTFFYINGKLIPASAILKAIRAAIVSNVVMNDAITVKIAAEPNPHKGATLEGIIKEGEKSYRYNIGSGLPLDKFANLIKVHADVYLNLDKIMQYAVTTVDYYNN